jgi:tripartite-type tricarboxylate transporter receptor subunit TctC
MLPKKPNQPTRRSVLALPLAAAPLLLPSARARAATYPDQPIHFALPFPPGGGADILARLVGQFVATRLGQPVVIDNRPGAGGNIAAEIVAKAPADGYTLLEGNLAHAVAMTMYRHIRYDINKDFAPVIALASEPFVLAVTPSLPVKSLADLLALARSEPGKLNYASSGVGGPSHLAMELLEYDAHIKMTHVPYKGAEPAANALMAGYVQVAFISVPPAAPLMASGKIRGLAVSSAHRTDALANVPTIAESGVPGYEAITWFGVLAPRGTPSAVVQTLNGAFGAALADPTIRKRLRAEGFQIMGGTPQQFAAYIQAEVKKWAPIVKAAKLIVD